MGAEFNIAKEFGNISATALELSTLVVPIRAEIANSEFHELFNHVISGPMSCYQLLLDNIKPLLRITSLEIFSEEFDGCLGAFRDNYKNDASKPRMFSEESYEYYLELQKKRELSTSYPILKHNFTRLKELVDKWITNDNWLAMSIDNLLKQLNRLLSEISDIKKRDSEQAYMLFYSIYVSLTAYSDLLLKSLASIEWKS